MGVAYNALLGQARTQLASDFCSQYGLNDTCTFTIRTYGGEDACVVLANYWVEIMSYFYGVWEASGEDPMYSFQEADLAGIPICQKLEELLANGDARMRSKVAMLRGLRPKEPQE